MKPNVFCFALCIAYTKGRCCTDVVFLGNCMLSKIYEWRGQLDACIFSGDIATAFDSCKITAVASAMNAAGIPAKTVACYLELQCDLTLRPEFARVQVPDCSYSGALRQDGKDGPFGFNIVLRWFLHILHEGWIAPYRLFGAETWEECKCACSSTVSNSSISLTLNVLTFMLNHLK